LTDKIDIDEMTDRIDDAVNEPEQDGIEVRMIEAPGVIIDTYTGKTWAVPTATFDDNIRMHQSPYDIKKDPQFHYEAHGLTEVADMEAQGFVKVTNKEMGRDSIKLPGETATPLDSYYTIGGDQVMMKIPQVIAERRYEALKKICDSALEATQPPPIVQDGKNGRANTEEMERSNRLRSDNLSQEELEHRTTKDLQEAIRK
jgi:hypothetical protein